MSVKNNLCRKLVSSLKSPIKFGERFKLLSCELEYVIHIMVEDFILVENLTSVFSQPFIFVHMNWGEMKVKLIWISNQSFWPKWNCKLAWDFHVNKIYPKRNELAQAIWILSLTRTYARNSLRVLFHCGHKIKIKIKFDRNKISFCDKVSYKRYPKWRKSIKLSGRLEIQPK